jgi:hypothetical protein
MGALFIVKLTIKFITNYDALREIAESWTDTGYRLGGMVEWRRARTCRWACVIAAR